MAAPVFRLLVCYFLFSFVAVTVLCYSVDEKVYIHLQHADNYCFRQLNGTHQFGCSSQPGSGGNVGILHYVEQKSDVDWIKDTGPHAPYVVMLEPDMFTRSVVIGLRDSGKVNGILLVRLNETYPLAGYSSDKSCPGQYAGMYSENSDYKDCKETVWNPTGSGLFTEDLNMPVFLIKNTTEIDYLFNKCWKRNKPINGEPREYPLCGAELKATMAAALNSEVCHRRSNTITNLSPEQYCDPMGDRNVFTTFQAVTANETLPDKSVVMAMTRMDGFSLFYDVIPGADTPVASVVALLAASEALAKPGVKEEIIKSKNDILLMFLNGESYDYIGSSRLVYDLANGLFRTNTTHKDHGLHTINLKHLKGVVEVGQVGHGVDSKKLFIHTDDDNKKAAKEVPTMITTIKDSVGSLGLTVDEATTKSLPPASLQTFLKNDSSVPGVLITDYDKVFSNKYYHSIYDDAELIQAGYPEGTLENATIVTEQAKYLQKVATVVARSLFTMATGNANNSNVEANETTVNQLLYCFLYNKQCEFFQSVLSTKNAIALRKTNFTFYVGVDRSVGWMAPLTKKLLAYYTGERIDITTTVDGEIKYNKTKCTELHSLSKRKGEGWNYLFLQGPIVDDARIPLCVKTLSNYSDAISPAFIIKDYNFSSGLYPTWTESVWDSGIYVRIFVIPSERLTTITLSIGVIVLLVSGVVMFFISRRATILFPHTESAQTL